MKKSRTSLTVIAVFVGIFILSSVFSGNSALLNVGGAFLNWAAIMSSVLLLFSLIEQIIRQIKNPGHNIAEVIIRIAGFAAFLFLLLLGLTEGFGGKIFNDAAYTIQNSIETTLAALVCLGIIFALFRLPRWHKNRLRTAFVAGFFIFLLIYSGALSYFPIPLPAQRAIEWIGTIPLGGFYGMLLGIALGALITGIRFVFFGKHPYKGGK